MRTFVSFCDKLYALVHITTVLEIDKQLMIRYVQNGHYTSNPAWYNVCFRLRSSHLKFKFVTNTTKESKRVLLERLRTIGFDVQDHEVFTSLTAARDLVATRGLSPLLLVDDKALEDFQGSYTEFILFTKFPTGAKLI